MGSDPNLMDKHFARLVREADTRGDAAIENADNPYQT